MRLCKESKITSTLKIPYAFLFKQGIGKNQEVIFDPLLWHLGFFYIALRL